MRTAPPALVMALATGALALGIASMLEPGEGEGLAALLFPAQPQPLCLRLDRQHNVEGTVGGTMAPGEAVEGTLAIDHCDASPDVLLDLDIDFRDTTTDLPPASTVGLTSFLLLDLLRYGEDDLLADDPGLVDDRNLTREIDADPLRGNGDGRVSLRELRAGANDLRSPPAAPASVRFDMRVHLATTAAAGEQGDRATVDIVFFLSDRAHADLN